MKDLVVKKCNNCGALIRVLKDCTCNECGIKCCSNSMKELKPNSVDAAFEKHLPQYFIDGDNLVVTVNHVMEEDHYIEWIAFVNDTGEQFIYFKLGDECKAVFKYSKGKLYSYCNKHSLWMIEVK